MSAAEALRIAHDAGVLVALDGLDLVLEAPAEPPPDLLKLLTERKADIVKLLRRQDDDAPDASPPLATAFAALERRCPDYVEPGNRLSRTVAASSPTGATRPKRSVGPNGICSGSTSCPRIRTLPTAG
jgi:hypothetical protein